MLKNHRERFFEKGVTLMETLIVIGLLACLLAVVLPQFVTILRKYRAETAVEQVAMNLRFARLAAVKKRIPYKVLFNPTPTNTYQVQMNPSRDSVTWVDYTLVDTTLPGNLTILAGGISDVVYSPRGSATISGGSNIRIQSNNHLNGIDVKYRIDVYTTGAVTKTAE